MCFTLSGKSSLCSTKSTKQKPVPASEQCKRKGIDTAAAKYKWLLKERKRKNLHFQVKWTQAQIPAAEGVNDKVEENKRRCFSLAVLRIMLYSSFISYIYP